MTVCVWRVWTVECSIEHQQREKTFPDFLYFSLLSCSGAAGNFFSAKLLQCIAHSHTHTQLLLVIAVLLVQYFVFISLSLLRHVIFPREHTHTNASNMRNAECKIMKRQKSAAERWRWTWKRGATMHELNRMHNKMTICTTINFIRSFREHEMEFTFQRCRCCCCWLFVCRSQGSVSIGNGYYGNVCPMQNWMQRSIHWITFAYRYCDTASHHMTSTIDKKRAFRVTFMSFCFHLIGSFNEYPFRK